MARARTADTARRLGFVAGGERSTLPAAMVREIVRVGRIAVVPHAPPSLLGLVNVRGAVVPVVSAAALLDRPASAAKRLILIDRGDPIALAVDEVETLGATGGTIDLEALLARDFDARRSVPRARAATVSRAGPGAEAIADGVALVSFLVGGQEFALPLREVEAIVRMPLAVTLLPHADPAVVGSIALDDAILPLLSLHRLLALPGEEEDRGRIVVVRIGTHRIGLAVGAIRSVLRVSDDRIDPIPPALSRGQAEARIQAICRLDEGRRLVAVLAVEHLLREDMTNRLLQSFDRRTEEEAKETGATLERFLAFRIGAQEFALPLEAVDQVVALPEAPTRLPKVPAFVRGVMNLRGRVVPIIDQGQRFGVASAAGGRQRVVVTRIGAQVAGFVVDAASEVLAVPVTAIGPAPDLGRDGADLFERVITPAGEGRLLLVANPRLLLDRAEQEMLDAVVDAARPTPKRRH